LPPNSVKQLKNLFT